MLRETEGWHEGNGGSLVVVASVISAVMAVKRGKGPLPEITSAPAHKSFGGATSGPLCKPAFKAAARRRFSSNCTFRSGTLTGEAAASLFRFSIESAEAKCTIPLESIAEPEGEATCAFIWVRPS